LGSSITWTTDCHQCVVSTLHILKLSVCFGWTTINALYKGDNKNDSSDCYSALYHARAGTVP
jgi:hypothetical protein